VEEVLKGRDSEPPVLMVDVQQARTWGSAPTLGGCRMVRACLQQCRRRSTRSGLQWG
jgi:hypothetical protein